MNPGGNPRILVVDDDEQIRDLLVGYFRRHGYTADAAADGDAMRRVMSRSDVDLLILDLMMPGEDGLAICRALRADPASDRLPIIMLTALGEDSDRIVGLEVGADDYLGKPFNPRELLARVRALWRRAGPESAPLVESDQCRFGRWCLDVASRTLTSSTGKPCDLTAGEFALLVTLLQSAGRVMSRDQLLTATHGRQAGPFDRSVDVQISRLRQKIEVDPARPALLKTVRGVGYMLAGEVKWGD